MSDLERMAREAGGIEIALMPQNYSFDQASLERLAAAIRADERKKLGASVLKAIYARDIAPLTEISRAFSYGVNSAWSAAHAEFVVSDLRAGSEPAGRSEGSHEQP